MSGCVGVCGRFCFYVCLTEKVRVFLCLCVYELERETESVRGGRWGLNVWGGCIVCVHVCVYARVCVCVCECF